MKKLSILSLALAVILTGCLTQRDDKTTDRATLQAGQQVSAEMVGWVAVPPCNAQVKQDKGISYAVLPAHCVIPKTMDEWVAVNPEFFTKLSEIKVEVPVAVEAQRWVLKPEGKSVPKDKQGWIAVPYSEPIIEKSDYKKDRQMAVLASNNIVPKEMNGFVAIDRDTLAKLVAAYMSTGPGSKASK
ncbi:MAG TPA: hypothetical protein VGP72_21765 [Planctomycetota bacterium]|jgi:hypothetical protein